MTSHKVNVGINYRPHGKGEDEVRAEPGDVVDDLPPKIVKHWLAEGVIEPLEEGDS